MPLNHASTLQEPPRSPASSANSTINLEQKGSTHKCQHQLRITPGSGLRRKPSATETNQSFIIHITSPASPQTPPQPVVQSKQASSLSLSLCLAFYTLNIETKNNGRLWYIYIYIYKYPSTLIYSNLFANILAISKSI